MDITTYTKARQIRKELEACYDAIKIVKANFYSVKIGETELPGTQSLSNKIANAIAEYAKEKEEEFEKL